MYVYIQTYIHLHTHTQKQTRNKTLVSFFVRLHMGLYTGLNETLLHDGLRHFDEDVGLNVQVCMCMRACAHTTYVCGSYCRLGRKLLQTGDRFCFPAQTSCSARFDSTSGRCVFKHRRCCPAARREVDSLTEETDINLEKFPERL